MVTKNAVFMRSVAFRKRLISIYNERGIVFIILFRYNLYVTIHLSPYIRKKQHDKSYFLTAPKLICASMRR